MKILAFIDSLIYWNRKLHIYIGLFLTLYILFFSLSGLLLNHSQWKFAGFWKERKETEIITPVLIPVNPDSSALPQQFMRQLNITGEISNVKITSEGISFRVVKPGTNRDIRVDFKKGISVSKEMVFNWWGKMRILHTFNGSDKTNPDVKPNWINTRIWRLTMDVVAIGLIFLCISSWIMWYKIRQSYYGAMIVIISGFAIAIFLVFLLCLL